MRETAEFDVKDFEDVEGTKGVYPRFYKRPKLDAAASAREGRQVYKEVDYIEIVAAGNQNNVVDRPVTDLDKRRFSRQWEQYSAGDTEQLNGTPLTEVTWIARSQVEELLYRKVRTLEQLSELPDNVCGSMPGMFELKRKATTWLANAEKAKPFTEMESKMAEMAKTIELLQSQIASGAKKGRSADNG